MLFWRVSKSAKSTVNNSRGLLFDAYQERLGEICNELPRLCGEHVFRWGQYQDEEKNGRSYKCKDRVSIDLGRGDNSRITGYVVQVAERFVTYIREDTMFLAEPIIAVLGACWGTEELGWNERSRKKLRDVRQQSSGFENYKL